MTDPSRYAIPADVTLQITDAILTSRKLAQAIVDRQSVTAVMTWQRFVDRVTRYGQGANTAAVFAEEHGRV